MATNYAHATYQEIYDLNTVEGKVSVIGIHTPVGSKPRQMLGGFFRQFRKFRYNGIKSLTLVPAARLPVNILDLDLEAGSDTADMRDVVNPILYHGCHGESLNDALNMIYKGNAPLSGKVGASVDVFEVDKDQQIDPALEGSEMENFYYASMCDTSFGKSNVSSPLRLRNLHPLVHNIVGSRPLVGFNGNIEGSVGWSSNNAQIVGMSKAVPRVFDENGQAQAVAPFMFATNKMQRLGWLPTTGMGTDGNVAEGGYLGKLMMMVLMLPPSYRVKNFFRLVVTHSYSFKEFTTSLVGDRNISWDYNDFADHPIGGVASSMSYSTGADPKESELVDVSSVDTIDADVRLVTSGVH